MSGPPVTARAAGLALGAGIVFGVGLVVSGMADPRNVVSFLDVTGRWDPALAFVMAGAIGVHATVLRVTRARVAAADSAPRSLGSAATLGRVDGALVGGAAIFGVGWGLGGFCPGPGIVALGTGALTPVLFVVAMLAGVALAELRSRAPATDAAHLERPPAPGSDGPASASTS